MTAISLSPSSTSSSPSSPLSSYSSSSYSSSSYSFLFYPPFYTCNVVHIKNTCPPTLLISQFISHRSLHHLRASSTRTHNYVFLIRFAKRPSVSAAWKKKGSVRIIIPSPSFIKTAATVYSGIRWYPMNLVTSTGDIQIVCEREDKYYKLEERGWGLGCVCPW